MGDGSEKKRAKESGGNVRKVRQEAGGAAKERKERVRPLSF